MCHDSSVGLSILNVSSCRLAINKFDAIVVFLRISMLCE